MNLSTAEQDQIKRFDKVYVQGRTDLMRKINRHICGCDFDATSWMTKDEADRIAGLLELSQDTGLLDLGSGAGWPAVYFAREFGCNVLMVDLPQEGLRSARVRAESDGVAGLCQTIVADAAVLPLEDGSFDRIHHADLLCCLLNKQGVLAECRRVATPGARMVFTVISVAPGLTASEHAAVVASGPEFVDTDQNYPDMLKNSGWEIEAIHDLNREFLAATERKSEIFKREHVALVKMLGSEQTAQMKAKYQIRKDNLINRHQVREMYVVCAR